MHNNVIYSLPSGGDLRILRDTEGSWVGARQISGQHKWLETGSADLTTAAEWTESVSGENPSFVSLAAKDLRPAPGRTLIDAGTASGTPPPGLPFPNRLTLPP